MNGWEKQLFDVCNEKCNELGYTDSECIDNIYDIFHEALELDEKSEEYRHKIKEIRKGTILDLTIDTLGCISDADYLVDEILKALDVMLK